MPQCPTQYIDLYVPVCKIQQLYALPQTKSNSVYKATIVSSQTAI